MPFQPDRLAAEIRDLLERGLVHSANSLLDFLPDKHTVPQRDLRKEDAKIKALFLSKEYERCYQETKSSLGFSQASVFLGHYAKYLCLVRNSVEKTLEENIERNSAHRSEGVKELLDTLKEHTDSYSLYLMAEAFLFLKQKAEAFDCAVGSIKKNQLNWACWEVLLRLAVEDPGLLADNLLEESPLKTIFTIRLHRETDSEAEQCRRLLSENEALLGQSYLAQETKCFLLYQERNFEKAREEYEALGRAHPFRLDHVDTLSNILFILGDIHALTLLANRVTSVDRFRPESCVALGNCNSLRGNHEEAILFFRRALKLDPAHSTAWTLMGHEYIELSNLAGSIECYRRAVDKNKKDYRAWYGLGQAYEMLKLPTYAVYYYKTAFSVKKDCRIQEAIEECEKLC
ncbi:MAG: anaphase-promoting complex subunit Apc8/Cdc23 [Amphiamblys sp. WSBS2006]|nr:MAG: anaphase-promoting complex subunit Apc8/Cdc23 [Amphiamblys sp. WSBS2006]